MPSSPSCYIQLLDLTLCGLLQKHVHSEALAPYSLDDPLLAKHAMHAVKSVLGMASEGQAEGTSSASSHKPPPAEIDASLVPGLDTSTARLAMETAPLVFLCRWLELHAEVCTLCHAL